MNKSKYKKVKWLFGKEIKIPEEWKIQKLIDISSRKPEYGSGDAALPYDSKLARYIRITDINDAGQLKDEKVSAKLTNNQQYVLEQNDFLFARTGSVGRTFLFSSDQGLCVYAGYLIRFKLNEKRILPVFLHHYTHGDVYWTWVTSELTQGVQPNVNAQQYSKLPILLPTLQEQTKIASILSGVDALIEKTQQIIVKYENLKRGLMQQLLTRGINHKKFKKVKWLFGKKIEIPKEWKTQQLGKNSSLKGRIGWQGLTTSEYLVTGNYHLVTGTDFKNGKIDWENCVYVNKDRYIQDPNIQLKNADILVTKDGTIGKIAFVSLPKKPATLNSGVFVIRPIDNQYRPLFLYYILFSDYFEKFLNKLKAGSTINHLYQKNFVGFKFPIPTLAEQTKIASILSGVDAYIQKNQEYKKKLEELKKGLMQKLLTGQIRVKV